MATSSTIPNFSSILEAYAKNKADEEQSFLEKAKPFLTEIIESEMRGVPNKVTIIDYHVAAKIYEILSVEGWNVRLVECEGGGRGSTYYRIEVLVDGQA